MPRNIRMILAYDGTEFHGWQKQPGMRTVQDVIEQAARRVVRHQLTVLGSGRTDAGVHAIGQVANFLTTCDIPCDNLRKAIGSRLPKDVSIYHVCEVPLSFRASSSPVRKMYRYTIWNDADRPVSGQLQRYTYHFWHPLDLGAMRTGARVLVGTHDFAAFATQGSKRETTVRTVCHLEIGRHLHEVRIDVVGTGFLYNQVRNIVGTLVEVGRGHWEPRRVAQILAGRDRSQAGPTAPARGLCLQWVKYDLPALVEADAQALRADIERPQDKTTDPDMKSMDARE